MTSDTCKEGKFTALIFYSMKVLINYFSVTCIMLFSILSCTPDNPPPNPPASNTVTVSWQATINGVSYNYSDTHTGEGPTNSQGNNEGECLYNFTILRLMKGGPFTAGDLVLIDIGSSSAITVGTYNITQNGNISMVVGVNNTPLGSSLDVNTNVTLNITEISPGVGLVKGNFSGVLGGAPGGGTTPVSGQFEAYKAY